MRRHLGEDRIDPLPLVGHDRTATEPTAVFEVGAGRSKVPVHTEPGNPRPLTCRSTSDSTGLSHRQVAIEPL